MIRNSIDLLVYISEHGGNIVLSDATLSELNMDRLTLESYLDELETKGYVKRFMRSYGITREGTDYLIN